MNFGECIVLGVWFVECVIYILYSDEIVFFQPYQSLLDAQTTALISQLFPWSAAGHSTKWGGGFTQDCKARSYSQWAAVPGPAFWICMSKTHTHMQNREHTHAHTQSHNIALSHNLNWLPRAYQLPCSPKALCMFFECLAYAAVTWDISLSLFLFLSPLHAHTRVHKHTMFPEVALFSSFTYFPSGP